MITSSREEAKPSGLQPEVGFYRAVLSYKYSGGRNGLVINRLGV